MPTHARSHIATSFIALSMLVAAPVMAADDGQGLNLSTSLRSKMFWKLNVVSTKTKTKSGSPRDLTPQIVSIVELTEMRNQKAKDLYSRIKSNLPGITETDFITAINNTAITSPGATMTQIRNALKTRQDMIDLGKIKTYGDPAQGGLTAIKLLDGALSGLVDDPDPELQGYGFASGDGYLTTPQGILVKSADPSATVALSVGAYLNDDQNWAVEALLLGAPLSATIYGAGTNDRGEPNQLVGQKLIQTKMLPPIAKFGYYFGNKKSIVRPYVGIGAMYAIFFDTKTTGFFNRYQGGESSVSLKNAFGVGPFIGLESGSNSDWKIGFSVGKIKISTEATLSTRGTMFKTGDLALLDYKLATVNAIAQAETLLNIANNNTNNAANNATTDVAIKASTPETAYNLAPNGYTTELMKDLAAYKRDFKGGDGTLGTFVRKQTSKLDNTIFMLSIGRSF